MKHYNISVNFSGFYGTEHEMVIDSIVSNFFGEEDYDDSLVDYKKLRAEYSKEFINFINYMLETSIEFSSVYSPKQYNYENDSILAVISEQDYKKIASLFNKNYKKEFKEFITYKTTSRDGFIPLYTKDEILKKEENKDLLIDNMLEFLFKEDRELSRKEWEEYFDRNCLYELMHRKNFLKKEEPKKTKTHSPS